MSNVFCNRNSVVGAIFFPEISHLYFQLFISNSACLAWPHVNLITVSVDQFMDYEAIILRNICGDMPFYVSTCYNCSTHDEHTQAKVMQIDQQHFSGQTIKLLLVLNYVVCCMLGQLFQNYFKMLYFHSSIICKDFALVAFAL